MKIGGLELVEIDYLSGKFGITRRAAFKWLRTLNLTTLNIDDKAYFSLEALEIALQVIVEAGIVFSMPGSAKKLAGKKVCCGLVAMTDKMQKRVCDVQTQVTDNLTKEVKLWEVEKKQLKQAKEMLVKLRKVIKRQEAQF